MGHPLVFAVGFISLKFVFFNFFSNFSLSIRSDMDPALFI